MGWGRPRARTAQLPALLTGRPLSLYRVPTCPHPPSPAPPGSSRTLPSCSTCCQRRCSWSGCACRWRHTAAAQSPTCSSLWTPRQPLMQLRARARWRPAPRAANCRRRATCCTAGWRCTCWAATGSTWRGGLPSCVQPEMRRRPATWLRRLQRQSRRSTAFCHLTQGAWQTCRSRPCRRGQAPPRRRRGAAAPRCWRSRRGRQVH